MAGPFKLKSGNTPLFKTMGSSPLKEQPQTQRTQYTRARQSRAFGEGVSAREGAKLLRTSTWKYNKMKKDWLRSQKKKKAVKPTIKPGLQEEVEIKEPKKSEKFGAREFKREGTGDPYSYRSTGPGVTGQKYEFKSLGTEKGVEAGRTKGEWYEVGGGDALIDEAFIKAMKDFENINK